MPILATKLYRPPHRPNLVHRPRLIERLQAGLPGKLTLIAASAGFGKTTLVSEWLATRQGVNPSNTVAWLSLDEADSERTRFLIYLIAALQTIVPKVGEEMLGMLQSPQPPSTEWLLTTLLNEIAILPTQIILVLDDYHALATAGPLGAVDQALTFLLDHLPPQFHLVIITRVDPPLPLARLRVRGQLTELRAADLRFTPTEAAAFLHQVMALDLSAAEVAALETRTEGWVAGLQLAALSLQGGPRGALHTGGAVSQFIAQFAGDNRYVVDYLVEEVLQRQPDAVRHFLLQTAILERLSGPLCAAVTGQENSLALLDALERGNLFVVPLDDQRHWFRYHHLFAEMLMAHLLREAPTLVPILHQRASAWYAANGLPAGAIRHALAAQDFAHAAGLIEQAWPAMDGQFQAVTWLGWARALPDAVVRLRPVLSVAYAWALLNEGELEAAAARLADAEQRLDTVTKIPAQSEPSSATMIVVDQGQFRTLPASIATAYAYLAQARGDRPASVQYGRRALDLLPVDDHLRRGPAAALLGLAEWANGELENAYQALAAAMAGFQQIGSLQFAISVTSGLADIRVTQGRLHDAIHCYQQALQLALAAGEPLPRGTADLYLGLSELGCEQGDLVAATENLRHGERLGEQAALPDWHYRLCRAQARLQESQGDLAAALDRLDAAERFYYPTPLPAVRPLAAWKARLWLAQGRLPEARRWAREQALSVDDPLTFLREFEHITLARVLLAESQQNWPDATQEALRLLTRLQTAAEAGGRTGSVIEIKVLQALAHYQQGNLELALAALEHALRLAEPEGYVCVFAAEGPALAHLLVCAAGQGVLPAYVGRLLAVCEGVDTQPTASTVPPDPPPAHALVEPLSDREWEILRLIAQGLSNQEISTRLFLALSTVKGHNRNLFGKLQVQRRTEAVARARALGLL